LPHRRPDRSQAPGQTLGRAGRASRFSGRNGNPSAPAEGGTAKVMPLNQARRQRERLGNRPEVVAPEVKRPRPEPHPVWGPILYGVRLLVVGVGIGVIAGTLLSSLDPSLRYSADTAAQSGNAADSAQAGDVSALGAGKAANAQANGLQLTQEMTSLKTKLNSLAAAASGLTPGVFAVDLDNGSYVDINSNRKFASASTIKLPVLVAFFQAVDEGKVTFDELLAMRPDLIAKESGEMQTQEPGTKFSALYTATEMIRVSDNTATNMLVDRLGGAAELNQRFLAWGLTQTVLRNPLPDVEGTNTTSPRDLVTLLGRVNQGEMLTLRSRDRLLSILASNTINDLLPQGLGEGATIAHKTGNIGTVLGDVGLVDMPSGKRYLIMALVERPKGDERAAELIRQISRETYQYLESTASKSDRSAPSSPKVNLATTQNKP
jgi:beta-lactamase class A